MDTCQEETGLILTNMILDQMSLTFNIYPTTAIKYSTLSSEILVLEKKTENDFIDYESIQLEASKISDTGKH